MRYNTGEIFLFEATGKQVSCLHFDMSIDGYSELGSWVMHVENLCKKQVGFAL